MKKIAKKNIDRRGFLKAGALLAGGAILMAYAKNKIKTIGEISDDVDDNAIPGKSKVNPFNLEAKTVLLNSGYQIPIIGIGTFRLSTAQAEESV